MSTTQKSNPFDDIDGLVEALEKAPQGKEGAFRVATWLMVLTEIQTLKNQLQGTVEDIQNVKDSTPSADDIATKVKDDLNSNLADKEADVILF